MGNPANWLPWAILSACFAALTAIFAKIGVRGVDPDFATLIRTALIFLVLVPFVWLTGKWSNPFNLPGKTWLFLTLSGLATGASWVCYFRALQIGEASKVAPIDRNTAAATQLKNVTMLISTTNPRCESERFGVITASM